MSDHAPSGWTLLLAELATGAGLAHIFDGWPPALVGFSSALFVGVTLRLLDPLLRVRGEAIARRLTPAPPAPVAPRSRAVLVVDDHDGTRHLLAAMLRDALGCTVHEARSGAEARGLHARHRPAAVVCDLMLPDELGSDVLAAIGRPGDVLTSGVADADALDAAAHRCGATAMRKPLDRTRIVDHLTAALAA